MTILYTTMPLELVLEGIDREGPQYQEVEVAGAKLMLEQTGIAQGRVVRLLSTDPRDYLLAQYQPGTEVRFVPQFSTDEE
ncbi:MAG: YlzJ-like family protein [Bacillota bacterium]